MNPTRDFDAVLTRVADGEAVDWESASQTAVTPDEADLLRQLRILEQLAETHRAAGEATGPVDERDMLARRAAIPAAAHPEARRWGRYRLVRRIGQGSFGDVYLARDEELDRDIAIKLLHASPGAEVSTRVRHEGRALARVRHPNVLTVYDVEEHEGQLGLCMEYVDGRTLDALVGTDGPLNASEAIVIGQAVCRALAALHAAGIVHRDVKARNVVRERAGRIVLMDMGAVLDFRQGSREATSVGTPIYMAPELFEGVPATLQSDVYAAGVLLYYLVTGGYPVTGASPGEVRTAHQRKRRTRLDDRRLDLPAPFVRVVERATAEDLGLRYESASAMLRELGEVAPEPKPIEAEWVRFAKTATKVTLAVVALALLSGLLASQTFNTVLDRPASFGSESSVDLLVLGLRSLKLPAAVAGALSAALGVAHLVLRWFPWRRLWRDIRARLGVTWTIPPHERAAVLSRIVVIAGLVALALVFISFGDIIYALGDSLSADDLDSFLSLAPANYEQTVAYRLTLPALFFFVAAAWKGVVRVRLSHGGTIPGSVRGAAIALGALVIFLAQAPYKLFADSELPVAVVEGQRCYLLGERANDRRVYCPTSRVPRVRSVSRTVVIQECGFDESVFIAPSFPGCTANDEP